MSLTGADGTCDDKQCTQSVSTTYTRWGKSSCPKENNATLVYKGMFTLLKK